MSSLHPLSDLCVRVCVSACVCVLGVCLWACVCVCGMCVCGVSVRVCGGGGRSIIRIDPEPGTELAQHTWLSMMELSCG